MRAWVMALALGVVLVFGAGCDFKSPQMSVHSAVIMNPVFTGVPVEIRMNVLNTNAADLRLVRLRGQAVMPFTIVPIDVQPNTWLYEDRTVPMAVTVVIPWAAIPGLIANTAMGGPMIQAQIVGKADVTVTSTFGIEVKEVDVSETAYIDRAVVLDAARSRFPGLK